MSGAAQWRVEFPADGGEVIRLAARELAAGLSAMLGEAVPAEPAAELGTATLRVRRGGAPASAGAPLSVARNLSSELGPDGFGWDRLSSLSSSFLRPPAAKLVPPQAVAGPTTHHPPPRDALLLAAGSERAALAAGAELLQQLGARFPLSGAPRWPRLDPQRLGDLQPLRVSPAFARRAIVSDLMTWHYETPARLTAHLDGDRHFLRWMGARGLNAFSFIRHALDSRPKIDELVPLCRERGIGREYGGHVLQLLMPSGSFGKNPEFFPASIGGKRNSRGNLCVSNPQALRVVRDGAVSYLEQNPECEMLHIWGADVWDGAWCKCGECASMSPQLQYMKIINAVAEVLAGRGNSPPLGYLAYHDTIEPDAALRPLSNVYFEWAPRERCYSHSIGDPACEINPRYFEMLKRYLDLFDGRGHVFEYYADTILFGGIAVATPAVIAADMQAYRKLGVSGISCLTFGTHSAITCPVNLEAFARGTRNPDFEPEHVLADTATAIHPACGSEMAAAYRAIARASSLILDGGGDMMRPKLPAGGQRPYHQARLVRLQSAARQIAAAIEAADAIVAGARDDLRRFERTTWHYSREVVSGIHDYLAAADAPGMERNARADAAIERLASAVEQLRAAAPTAADTWAAYDLEWIRDIWLKGLKRRFGEFQSSCD